MVSRETSVASALARLGLLDDPGVVGTLLRFADLLVAEAIPSGFVGPNEGPQILGRHILDSAAIGRLVRPAGLVGGQRVIDVGSGAGLPGVVLAILGHDVIAVESQERRSDFLERAAVELEISLVVVRNRAEDAARGLLRESADAVVARALAEPAVALELTLPFARVGAAVVLPTTVEAVDASPDSADGAPIGSLGPVAAQLGGDSPVLRRIDVPDVDSSVAGAELARWFIMVSKVAQTSDRFPRRTGVPKRRPLG